MKTILIFALIFVAQVSHAGQNCRTPWFDANINGDFIEIPANNMAELNSAVSTFRLSYPLSIERNSICKTGIEPEYCVTGMIDKDLLLVEFRDIRLNIVFSQVFRCR